MAVYYKWIKGCQAGASLVKGLWTYLKWGEGSVGLSVDNLPHIFTYKGKQDNPTKENDLGYILTNKATGIQIEKPWTFKDNITCNDHLKTNNFIIPNETYTFLIGINDTPTIYIGDSEKPNAYASHYIADEICFGNSIFLCNKTTNGKIRDRVHFWPTDTGLVCQFEQPNSLLELSKGGLLVDKQIKSKESIEAPYFNATSDKRAKDNIHLATFDALKLIKKLSIYTFNYKQQQDIIPGILAQDLLWECKYNNINLDLVNNINATGENNDYMSIKEDKLVYICMKAIQEQQKIIESLRRDIERLEHNY